MKLAFETKIFYFNTIYLLIMKILHEKYKNDGSKTGRLFPSNL